MLPWTLAFTTLLLQTLKVDAKHLWASQKETSKGEPGTKSQIRQVLTVTMLRSRLLRPRRYMDTTREHHGTLHTQTRL